MSILVAVLALAATQSAEWAGRDNELRFEFVRDSGTVRDRSTLISGTGPGPAEWSVPELVRVVKQCGGHGIGAQVNNAYRISLVSHPTGRDLDVVRCVKQSTAATFRVGTSNAGSFVPFAFDQQPFSSLWDSQQNTSR